jgi:NTE family protein
VSAQLSRSDPGVGLVLSGGGARGAYEAGALDVLLPELEKRGQRPGIVLGTSIGALNASHLADTAHVPASEAVASLAKLWCEVQFSDIIGPLGSPLEIARLARLGLGGLLSTSAPALLDTRPLAGVLRKLIEFERMHANCATGLVSVGVVATSYATGESVVFHDRQSDEAIEDDRRRGIRYVPTALDETHVQASAAIPVAFPATWVEKPGDASGWYGDGGTRLNTPIKPALKLGAKRVVVIGLDSAEPPPDPERGRPDVFDGAAQFLQALFADPLTQDVETLAGQNVVAKAGASPGPGSPDEVPYIFIAPSDREVVGRIAREVFREHLCRVRAMMRARDLVLLGTLIGAGRDADRGELFSLLFFATEFHQALIELGRSDAQRWLDASHDHEDGLWQVGPLPLPPSPSGRAKPRRQRRMRAGSGVRPSAAGARR